MLPQKVNGYSKIVDSLNDEDERIIVYENSDTKVTVEFVEDEDGWSMNISDTNDIATDISDDDLNAFYDILCALSGGDGT